MDYFMIALAGSMPQGVDDAGSRADVFAVLPLRRRHGIGEQLPIARSGVRSDGLDQQF